MAGQARRRTLRFVSLFVLIAFTGSLVSPAVMAQATTTHTGVPVDTNVMTQNAKVALSDLWYAWVKQGGSSSVTPDRQFAFNFFKSKGATESQATLLTNNAQSTGQLNQSLPSSQSGLAGLWDKITGIFRGNSSTKGAALAAGSSSSSSGTGLVSRVKSALGIGTGSASTQSSHQTAATATTPGTAKLGDKFHNTLNTIGDKVQQAGQKVGGVVHDAGAGLTTALLTAKDKFDIRQFYNIPISNTQNLKITGGSSYDIKFTNKGWVNQEMTAKVNLVDAIKADEALLQVKQLETAAGPAEASYSGLGKFTSKFSQALTNLKNKITGKTTLNTAESQELGKLKIESNLLEHAQGLTQAQNAIKTRMENLVSNAKKYGREVPQEELSNLKRTYDSIETQKRDVLDKMNGVQKSSAGQVVSQGVKWALYSVGITAGVNIIKQVVSGEKVDFKSALSFVGQPSFWGGTVGGFVGSLVLSNVASALIPGGGIFMKILPGFLGAALGYEAGASMFGGGSGDWIGTIGQSLASAGGYALAYSLLGGAMAPGIALIGAGIAAGALFNFIWAKIRQNPDSQSGADQLPTSNLEISVDPQANTTATENATAVNGSAQTTTDSAALGNSMRDMQTAYTEYINFLKDGKATDAKSAFDRYIQAKDKLDAARQAAVQTAQ